ncbi:hypothetical protein HK101_008345 [Irineochytrium annulatum]|nr:hypothetical protein HK101_008345 [Irineochytrium annulatum]
MEANPILTSGFLKIRVARRSSSSISSSLPTAFSLPPAPSATSEKYVVLCQPTTVGSCTDLFAEIHNNISTRETLWRLSLAPDSETSVMSLGQIMKAAVNRSPLLIIIGNRNAIEYYHLDDVVNVLDESASKSPGNIVLQFRPSGNDIRLAAGDSKAYLRWIEALQKALKLSAARSRELTLSRVARMSSSGRDSPVSSATTERPAIDGVRKDSQTARWVADQGSHGRNLVNASPGSSLEIEAARRATASAANQPGAYGSLPRNLMQDMTGPAQQPPQPHQLAMVYNYDGRQLGDLRRSAEVGRGAAMANPADYRDSMVSNTFSWRSGATWTVEGSGSPRVLEMSPLRTVNEADGADATAGAEGFGDGTPPLAAVMLPDSATGTKGAGVQAEEVTAALLRVKEKHEANAGEATEQRPRNGTLKRLTQWLGASSMSTLEMDTEGTSPVPSPNKPSAPPSTPEAVPEQPRPTVQVAAPMVIVLPPTPSTPTQKLSPPLASPQPDETRPVSPKPVFTRRPTSPAPPARDPVAPRGLKRLSLMFKSSKSPTPSPLAPVASPRPSVADIKTASAQPSVAEETPVSETSGGPVVGDVIEDAADQCVDPIATASSIVATETAPVAQCATEVTKEDHSVMADVAHVMAAVEDMEAVPRPSKPLPTLPESHVVTETVVSQVVETNLSLTAQIPSVVDAVNTSTTTLAEEELPSLPIKEELPSLPAEEETVGLPAEVAAVKSEVAAAPRKPGFALFSKDKVKGWGNFSAKQS